jgi:hypothetical protein
VRLGIPNASFPPEKALEHHEPTREPGLDGADGYTQARADFPRTQTAEIRELEHLANVRVHARERLAHGNAIDRLRPDKERRHSRLGVSPELFQ